MRAVKSVLNAAGRVKRERPDLDEFSVSIKAIRDMNLSKFIAEDVVLFDNLFIGDFEVGNLLIFGGLYYQDCYLENCMDYKCNKQIEYLSECH